MGQADGTGPVDRSMHGVELEGNIMHGVHSEGNIMHGFESEGNIMHGVQSETNSMMPPLMCLSALRSGVWVVSGECLGTTTGDREDDDSLMHLTRSNTN